MSDEKNKGLFKTERGFSRFEFKTTRDEDCFIVDSSLATDSAILIGQSTDKAVTLRDGEWVSILPESGDVFLNNTMQLDREAAAALIPLLQNFVDHHTIAGDNSEMMVDVNRAGVILSKGAANVRVIERTLLTHYINNGAVDKVIELVNNQRDLMIELHQMVIKLKG